MSNRGLILACGAVVIGGVAGWQILAKYVAVQKDDTATSIIDAGVPPPVKPVGPFACTSLTAPMAPAIATSAPSVLATPALARWEQRDTALKARVPLDKLTIGVVADAHGNPEHLPTIRQRFVDSRVDLVVALGGMATPQGELEAMLTVLAEPAQWFVLAMPGDWEAVPTHQEANRVLAERGVVDGSRIRSIDTGHIRLVTLPGAPHVQRLLAGDQGCVHAPEDVAALTQLFAGAPGIRVLFSHVPPRQQGLDATDLGAEGVHIGELALADAMGITEVDVAIHGLVPTAISPGRASMADLGGKPLILSAGSAEGHPIPGHSRRPHLALIATLESNRITWSTVE